MTVVADHSGKRVRASERALTVTLKAIMACGLSVDKLLINGAQIEIHCAVFEDAPPKKDDGGLKQW